jgi:hypothetical protein
LLAKLSPLFTQAGSGKASDCVKAPCLWSPSLSTVGYAYFLNLPRSGLVQRSRSEAGRDLKTRKK